MHVISRKKLKEFWERHPEATSTLQAWHRVAEHATWEKFDDVKKTYASADQVGRCTVFDIGRKVRLITVIHFRVQRVYIRYVLTHQEYNRGTWKGEC